MIHYRGLTTLSFCDNLLNINKKIKVVETYYKKNINYYD